MKTKHLFILPLTLILLLACVSTPAPTPAPLHPAPTVTPFPTFALPTQVSTNIPELTAALKPLVPNFEHIVIVMFENKEFGTVIGNPLMPNYIALIGGDTFWY